jgi:hypothetical protein
VSAAQLEVRGRAAGTYTTSALGPMLTYTVPEGWRVDEFPGSVTIAPPRHEGWPPIWILGDVRAADQTCADRPEPGVGTSAREIATWLTERPSITAARPVPVEVGGLSGYAVDLRLTDGWTGGCRINGPELANPTLFQPGSDAAELQWWVQPPGWTTRYYLLDLPTGATAVVDVEVDGDQAAWEAVFAQVQPVLDSFVFDAAAAG